MNRDLLQRRLSTYMFFFGCSLVLLGLWGLGTAAVAGVGLLLGMSMWGSGVAGFVWAFVVIPLLFAWVIEE